MLSAADLARQLPLDNATRTIVSVPVQEELRLHEQSISLYMISLWDVSISLKLMQPSKSFRKRAMGSWYEMVSDLH